MGPRAQLSQRPMGGQRAPPFWTPDTTRGGRAPPSSYPQAACDPWERPFCPPPAACDSWERPFCPPPTACDPWTPPTWLTGKDSGVAGSTLPEDNGLIHQPRLASVTLDQSRPRTLQTTTTKVLVNGHETPCLIASGSTESFIHPDTFCQSPAKTPGDWKDQHGNGEVLWASGSFPNVLLPHTRQNNGWKLFKQGGPRNERGSCYALTDDPLREVERTASISLSLMSGLPILFLSSVLAISRNGKPPAPISSIATVASNNRKYNLH
ncbi:uncharacterized protein [Scyliorhinus torazame]|uniref:uncharacterized protein n=1 Tax=Scyliorhinus torazame TaxID=75743 RepID=UPI003B59F425